MLITEVIVLFDKYTTINAINSIEAYKNLTIHVLTAYNRPGMP